MILAALSSGMAERSGITGTSALATVADMAPAVSGSPDALRESGGYGNMEEGRTYGWRVVGAV
jgi:hypothetical protein